MYQKCDIPGNSPELPTDKKGSSYPQLVLMFGGRDLYTVLRETTLFSLHQTLNIVGNFMIGFQQLQQHEVVHNDIKSLNILLNCNNDKLYLIDFGLATIKSDIYKYENMNVFTHPYATYPPEYRLIAELYRSSCKDSSSFITFIDNNFNKLIDACLFNINLDPVRRNELLKDRRIIEEGISSFIKKVKRELGQDPNIQNVFTKLWDKIDIYALGVVFNSILIAKCNKNQNLQVYQSLNKVFDSMRSPDPTDRPDVNKIIQDLKQISKMLQGGGTNTNVSYMNVNSNSRRSPRSQKIFDDLISEKKQASPEINPDIRNKQIENILSLSVPGQQDFFN